ncbi:MAG: glutamyl-tRNA reductase [Candidatus Acidulodesulfobacterium ferriphilum]|uniref:Glutamyl-tRNA reductase n=1 Tax=Candidatus Acidulodesulfobacterium ferriphilum TaxID=2597223 RepID=A0A519BDT6_9DELT|nr:MAG: glutamyl-tRNA reductase [Candidatus Acidulodesulfobacterium ferriphilum]
MDILIIGLSHKSADIGDREIVSKKILTPELRQEFAKKLLNLKDEEGRPLIKELAILTTCNRSEFIMDLSPWAVGKEAHFIKDYISGYFFVKKDADNLLYMYLNFEAVKHLFSVASSLDSMVIGEPQILGQIKDAYNESCEFRMNGQVLNKLFHKAFYCAKRVRTETKIASSPVSISYAAVELSKKIFNSLGDKKILLLGTGEMGKLTAKHFIKNGVHNIYIANRTKDKACHFVEESFGVNEKNCIDVIDFSEYYKLLPHTDIVLCSTGSEGYVLRYDDIMPVIKLRKQRPLFLIDISVPRNIDPEINKISNVYLYDIDDIGKMIEGNLEIREKEAVTASELVEINAKEFMEWKNSLNAVPVIVLLRNKVKDILEIELSKYIGEKKEKGLIINSLTNKILHEPITLIKKAAVDSSEANMLETLKTLFNLGLGTDKEIGHKRNNDNIINKECEKGSGDKNNLSKIKLIK